MSDWRLGIPGCQVSSGVGLETIGIPGCQVSSGVGLETRYAWLTSKLGCRTRDRGIPGCQVSSGVGQDNGVCQTVR